MGIKDSLGNWIVKPIYVEIESLGNGDFKVRNSEKFGVIDSNGRIVVPMNYDRIHATYIFSSRFYTVKLNNRFGVIRNCPSPDSPTA